ncbi:hypothetical protein MPSEU_000161700 [Mayamaea pseudoterrestris]|nr:hypothetical protein MPSEU_000161700 [Mayamaea pseudoterrestris]
MFLLTVNKTSIYGYRNDKRAVPNLTLALPLQTQTSRQKFLQNFVSSAASAALVAFSSSLPAHADAADKLGLTDNELKEVIRSDIVDRQFLATANLTPSIYRSTATFTDEIDSYGMQQWIKGTRKLFVGAKSQVRLVGDVNVTPEKAEFRFEEDLCFNIPFQPVVALSGKVVLERDEGGFITSYKEIWDQDVVTVLKSAKFN